MGADHQAAQNVEMHGIREATPAPQPLQPRQHFNSRTDASSIGSTPAPKYRDGPVTARFRQAANTCCCCSSSDSPLLDCPTGRTPTCALAPGAVRLSLAFTTDKSGEILHSRRALGQSL